MSLVKAAICVCVLKCFLHNIFWNKSERKECVYLCVLSRLLMHSRFVSLHVLKLYHSFLPVLSPSWRNTNENSLTDTLLHKYVCILKYVHLCVCVCVCRLHFMVQILLWGIVAINFITYFLLQLPSPDLDKYFQNLFHVEKPKLFLIHLSLLCLRGFSG